MGKPCAVRLKLLAQTNPRRLRYLLRIMTEVTVPHFLRAAILLPLILALAPAQDAIRVEPTHYRLAFENDKVQVVYIHYGPHEKSKEHSHPQGVVVNISEARLVFTDIEGKTREVYSKPGEARWFPPYQHTVENIGDTDYNGVYIAVKGGSSAGGSAERFPDLDEQSKETIALHVVGIDSGGGDAAQMQR